MVHDQEPRLICLLFTFKLDDNTSRGNIDAFRKALNNKWARLLVICILEFL